MNRLAKMLVAVSTAAVTVTTCSVPAQADPEVPGATQAGVHDAGWVKVHCKQFGSKASCGVRVPDGAAKVSLSMYYGGVFDHRAKFWDPEVDRTYSRKDEAWTDRVLTGVRWTCGHNGNAVYCTVELRKSVTDLNMTVFSKGDSLGGWKWTDIDEGVVLAQ